jgi:hypothetical protein
VARRVGCERIVDENELALAANDPKLELDVGDDESARGCVVRSSDVQFQSEMGNAVVEFWADERRRCCSGCWWIVELWGEKGEGEGGTSPCSGEMFSSCAPCSAFVESVKSGVGSFCDSWRPSGSGISCTVRDLYSAYAEPGENDRLGPG